MSRSLPSTARRRLPSALAAWFAIVALLAHALAAAPAAKVQPPAGDICFAAGKDGAPAQGAGHEHCALCAGMDAAPGAAMLRALAAPEADTPRIDGTGIVARRVDAASQRAPPA